MRFPIKAGSLAALLVALLVVVGLAGGGSVVGAQDPTATETEAVTSTPEVTEEATEAATQEPTQATGAGEGGQALTLDWQNIPLCIQLAATLGPTTDFSAQATAEATLEATATPTAAEPTATLDPEVTPYLGVLVGPVSECGVQVLDVFLASPAEEAELAIDDVIVAVDNTLVADQVGAVDESGAFNSTATEAFFRLIRSRLPGDVVTLTVQRNSLNTQVVVTLGSLPPELLGTPAGTPAGTVTATPSS